MDSIKAKCNEDIIEQFAIKKYNEGVVAERERVAELLAKDEKLCNEAMESVNCSEDNCIKCWVDYLNKSQPALNVDISTSTKKLVEELQQREGVYHNMPNSTGPAKILVVTD